MVLSVFFLQRNNLNGQELLAPKEAGKAGGNLMEVMDGILKYGKKRVGLVNLPFQAGFILLLPPLPVPMNCMQRVARSSDAAAVSKALPNSGIRTLQWDNEGSIEEMALCIINFP